MTTTWRLIACSLIGAAACGNAQRAVAIELLTAGDFEVPATETPPEVPSWTLTEFRATNPSAAADTASRTDFANQGGTTAGEFGLWVKGFAGNPTDGLATAILAQSVPAIPGETYSFAGNAAFETYYSGGVDTLEATSLFGAIPSPTRTEFELSFLDAQGAVIGSPLVRNLRDEVFNGFGYTAVSPLSGLAPANAASVRVRAMGIDMANNALNPQSAFFDNFTLTAASAPSTELLANAHLNEAPPAAPTPEEILSEHFDFIENPDTSTDIVRVETFANNPATGGVHGIWISPFLESAQGGSGIVSQTVAGVPGTEYTFSAGARWEANLLGDSNPDANKTEIELAFLDEMGAVIDSVVLDLRADGKTSAANSWTTHSVSGTAPAGTVEVKVSGIVSNLTTNPAGGAQSAFWDDFSLMAAGAGLAGDYNSDGKVDAADYTVWRDGNSPDDSQAGYDLWADNYGATSAPSAAVSVPEPTAAVLVLVGMASLVGRRRVN